MRQLFAPGADAILRLAMLTALLLIPVLFYTVSAVSRSSYVTGVGVALSQPVPFSHKHHSGELGLDCRNCHTQVEQQATAGLPPTSTCMTCHSQIWTQADMLAPVRDSLSDNKPLHWARVNKLPQYVYFNHAIHITKGVGCSSCHGAVDEMQLTSKANAFEMQFCLSCHREPDKFVRSKSEVWDMHWTAPSDQAERGKALVIERHIRSGAELTDCSICHR